MIYQFKSGAHYGGKGADPQQVGEELEKTRTQYGKLTADIVVHKATSPKSSMHGLFTWDNEEAARQHRLTEARLLLRSVVVVSAEEDAEPERAFWAVSVKEAEDEPAVRYYQSAEVISRNPKEYSSALQMMLQELVGAQASIKQLNNLAPKSDRPKIRTATSHLQEAHRVLTP